MSPGYVSSSYRGGTGYATRALNTSRNLNRAVSAPHGRVYGQHGTRQKFAVSTDPDTGAHSIALDNHESATIALNADGSCTIEVANKPNGNVGNNGNGAAVHTEPVQNARRSAGRQISKMSWEKDPMDGSVTFTPDANETLHVNGDPLMANVVAEPSPPGSAD
jgi:hypothetical protein